MGVKKSQIIKYTTTAPGGIIAPNWLTKAGSASFVYTTTGLHTLVPAPPAGTIRIVSKFSVSYAPVMSFVQVQATDNVGAVGDFDGYEVFNGSQIGPTLSASASAATPASSGAGTLVLQSTDTYQINVTALNNGADRILVSANWTDFDTTLLTNLTPNRFTIPDTTPITLWPAAPSGKTITGFTAPMSLVAVAPTGFIFNSDDISHNFNIDLVTGSIATLVGSSSINPLEGSPIASMMAIGSGQSLRLTMQEPVNTVVPFAHCPYLTLDNP